MELVLIRAISWFAEILIMLLCLRAIMSWFVRDFNTTLGSIYKIVISLTEPFVAPFRKLLANTNTGMLDFSVLIAFFAIEIVERLLITLIQLLF